jgi:hypothetical protein
MKRFRDFLNEGSKTEIAIMDFLKNNPAPKDDLIHDLAEKMGIEPDDFEAEVYKILGSFVGYGRAKDKKLDEKKVDKEQLKMGIKVEMEHTNNPTIAKRIALDHLAEISDYYTRLKKMEEEAGIKED